ncbi:MAG TPA: hypothetical protein VFP08_12520, partial [Acidimicrobiales bacterium]|nr:hypothetical protein [Acidimicrobiales bacterium]
MARQAPIPGAARLLALVAVVALVATASHATPAVAAAPPPNDDRSTPQVLGSLPATVDGDTSLATLDPTDAPLPCGVHEWTGTLWYSFTATVTEDVPLNLIAQAPSFPVAHIYRVGAGGVLQPAFCLLPQRTFVSVTAGETLMFMVAAPNQASVGPFTLRVGRYLAANDAATAATVMPATLPSEASGDNRDASADPGDPRPSCASAPPVTTLWYSFTPASSGPVWLNVGSPVGVQPPVAAMYALGTTGQLVEQACSGTTSPGAQAVSVVAGQPYLVMVGQDPLFGAAARDVTISFTARSTGPLNDRRSGAAAIPNPLPASLTGDTSAASAEATDPRPACATAGLAGTLWYTHRPTATGPVTAQVTSSANVVAALYRVDAPTTTPNGDLTYVGCAAPKATWKLSSTSTYVIVVGHRANKGGGGTFNLELSSSA